MLKKEQLWAEVANTTHTWCEGQEDPKQNPSGGKAKKTAKMMLATVLLPTLAFISPAFFFELFRVTRSR